MTKLTKDEEITKDAYDKHGVIWARNNDVAGYWAEYINKFKKLLPSGSVLDIGCGGGRDGKELVTLGYDYTGVDISDTFLNIAKQRLPGCNFYKQSVYELSFPKKFDGFWMVAVLLHIPKSRIDEALRRIKSVTKTGAVGFISIKDGDGELIVKDVLEGIQLERFFAYWSREDFEKALVKNGFAVEEYNYFPVTEKTRWHCFLVRNLGSDYIPKYAKG